MNVLEALWGGAIRPCERTVKRGTEYARLQKASQKAYDRFWSMLTPEGKEAYKAYSEANIELMSISEADIFTKGFRLGVQLLLAGICEDDSQLPPLEES